MRKATKDWNLDYRDEFEKIFKKFVNKITLPKGLDKSILKLNDIRNGIEHRENYPDISVVRKLIPDVEKFINWIIETTFNTSIDLYSIPLVDEEEIFVDFKKWKDEKLASNFKLTNEKLNRFYDYIFICLIPSTYSPNLVDMHFDGINEMLSAETKLKPVTVFWSNPEHKSKIESYFESFSYLFGSPAQVYTVSTHFRYYNDTYGNEMKIFPDGRIYICYTHRIFDPNKLSFNIENIYGRRKSFIIKEPKKKYGLTLDAYYPRNLECILKIITFTYYPKCKVKMINIPTKYFRALIILPLIRFKGKDRILDRSGEFKHIFDIEREYGGEDEDIVFRESFKYDEIRDLTKRFKNWTYGFFRNKSSTYFTGF